MTELTQAIVKLFETERFYAEIILKMDKIIDHSVPTMGVCVKDTIELHINPEFALQLSLEERVALLKHEVGHIVNDHISRAKELAPDIYSKGKKDVADRVINNLKHRSLNIAADCAINCNIENLPKTGVYPKTFHLEDGHTFEWYHNKMKQNENICTEYSNEAHKLWGDSEENKEILKETIKKVIEEAANKTRAAGKMTSNDELLVSRFNKSKDWKAELRRFAARTLQLLGVF